MHSESYYSEDELQEIGLASYGSNVKISRYARLYNPANIRVGSNIRIDDFALLSAGLGGIDIGNHVHIAAYCLLIGQEKITLNSFSGLSSRVSIYSSSDDYSGMHMTNPTIPEHLRSVLSSPVTLKKHVIIGASAVILPGVLIGEGSAVGAFSLVSKSIENNVIVSGIPAKKIKNRKKEIYKKEISYFKS